MEPITSMRTDGRKDKTKIVVAFLNSANKPIKIGYIKQRPV